MDEDQKRSKYKIWKNDLKKYIEPTIEGHCPYCHKPVKSIKHHVHDIHKGKKIPKKSDFS